MEINGPQAVQIVQRCWRPNQGDKSLPLNAIRYGFTQFEGALNGESIVLCRTHEHRVEIHCHGGRLASDTIIRNLVACGVKEQRPYAQETASSEDQIVLEAREDLLRADTLRTTAILLDQFRGALGRELVAIKSNILAGETVESTKRILNLNERTQLGSHLIVPWRVVLAGPPNSGKSSLLNMLLGYSRAIVHEQAGTTRDLLSERSSFEGWPIELIDGAGIRTAADAIEATGIDQILKCIASADCTLLLVDRTTGWTETHTRILNHCSGKVVLVVTKVDLNHIASKGVDDPLGNIPIPILARVNTSCVTGVGLKELIRSVVMFLVPQSPHAGDPVPFRQRHREAIDRLIECLPL